MTAERLLVVEDEEHLAEVISDNLELEGWEVEVVGDGTEALERIRADPPSLVLLDNFVDQQERLAVRDRGFNRFKCHGRISLV